MFSNRTHVVVRLNSDGSVKRYTWKLCIFERGKQQQQLWILSSSWFFVWIGNYVFLCTAKCIDAMQFFFSYSTLLFFSSCFAFSSCFIQHILIGSDSKMHEMKQHKRGTVKSKVKCLIVFFCSVLLVEYVFLCIHDSMYI